MSTIENDTDIKHYSSTTEVQARENMLELMVNCPIPQEQLLSNIGLFLDSKKLISVIIFRSFI